MPRQIRSLLAEVPGLSSKDLLEHFARYSGGPTAGVPPRWYVLVLSLGLLKYGFALAPWPVTLDGTGFGIAVAAGAFFLHMCIGLTLFQFLELWRTLDRLLVRLAAHPLRAAFERLGKSATPYIAGGLMSRVPRVGDLDRLVAAWPAVLKLATTMESAPQGRPLALAAGAESGPRMAASTSVASFSRWIDNRPVLEQRLQDDLVTASTQTLHWSSSHTGRTLLGGAHLLLPLLAPQWERRGQPDRVVTGGEDFVAMTLVLGIRELLARLGARLFFIMAGSLMLLGAVTLYPFSERQTLMAFGWVYMSVVVGIVLYVFVQVDRSEILGRLKGRADAGRFTLDREFITRAALYGALPILSLLTAQFPDLTRVLFEWIEPVRAVLP